MRAVLGIDAAWTSRNPSGVALAQETSNGWTLVTACSSYEQFTSECLGTPSHNGLVGRQLRSVPSLLASCQQRLGRPIDLIAVDMPLSHKDIEGRRASDNAISEAYGRRGASTHTPNVERPGSISTDLKNDLGKAGYPLLTEVIKCPGLIEVYPHPALIELTKADFRLPYKYGKRSKYWPDLSSEARLLTLEQQWREIVGPLDQHLSGVKSLLARLVPGMTGREMKAFEDALDAAVCAWVGICAIEGAAQAFGDEVSAIWVPRPT